MDPVEPSPPRSGILPLHNPVLSLLAVNLATIVLALVEGWDLLTVMFIYWFQSVTIGLFTVVRILALDERALTREFHNQASVEGASTEAIQRFAGFGKFFLAGFFALHYGLFHFGYYEFLGGWGLFGQAELVMTTEILLACGLFFLNHLYSFWYHRPREAVTGEVVKELFFAPYARIIPMHMTIVVGGFVSMLFFIAGLDATPLLLVFFLGVKTYVDVRMHLGKHEGTASPLLPLPGPGELRGNG